MTKAPETASEILLRTLDDWGDMGTDNIRDEIKKAAKLAKQMEWSLANDDATVPKA